MSIADGAETPDLAMVLPGHLDVWRKIYIARQRLSSQLRTGVRRGML